MMHSLNKDCEDGGRHCIIYEEKIFKFTTIMERKKKTNYDYRVEKLLNRWARE